MDNLNKISYYNTNKGKIMEGGFKLSYHLAIVLSKFKSYKNWIKDKEINKREMDFMKNKPKIDYEKLLGKKQKEENLDWIIDFDDEE